MANNGRHDASFRLYPDDRLWPGTRARGIYVDRSSMTGGLADDWVHMTFGIIDPVRDFGAKADGTTNDTTALLAMIAAMPSTGAVLSLPIGTYIIDASALNGLLFSGKTNFKILGNGATIKVKDGEACTGSYGMMYFASCTDGYVDNLILDANRANRSPNVASPAGAYSLAVTDSCARLHFKNIRSINSVIDAYTVYTAAKATAASYPTDITFDQCIADNALRNGFSAIDSLRLTIKGGRYVNTTGATNGPEAGIDIEPDAGASTGNTDITIEDVEVSGNAGVGIGFYGATANPNTNVVIRNIRGKSNAEGFLDLKNCTNVSVSGLRVGAHSAATRGIINLGNTGATCSNVHLSNIDITGITASGGSNAGIWVGTECTAPITLDGIHITDITCHALYIEQKTRVNGVHVQNCTYDPNVNIAGGTYTSVRDLNIDGGAGRSVYVNAAYTEIQGFKVVDCASTDRVFQFTASATNCALSNGSILQSSAIPGSQIGVLWQAAPRVFANVTAKSAGTDYTAANIASFSAGTSGSTVHDNVPDPFSAILSWDPGDLIAGAGETSSGITVTGATLGDFVEVSAPYDLQGIMATGFVSAANTVKIRIQNATAGSINLASGNWKVRVEKR